MNDNIFDKVLEFYNSYDKVSKINNYSIKLSETKINKNFLNDTKEMLYKLVRSIKSIKTYAKNEFSNNDNNNSIFNIIKIDSKDKINLFLTHSMFFAMDSSHTKKKLIIGLDFEFDQRKIALCQIALFPNRKHKYIYVIDPNMFTKTQLDLMVETLFISNIYKIVHGSDSLDVPYMFDELFEKDKNKIIKFTKNVIDTRFMCEYYKVYVSDINKKCSIYDAMLFFKTITQNKYDELNKINDTMGPIQDVNWNIVKMSSYNLKYAAYDVLFLKKFVFDIIHRSEKIDYLPDNMRAIPYIERFIFLEKHGILDNVAESKIITDPINNYIAHLKNGNKTLITIYNEMTDIIIPSLNLKIKSLLDINYFKSSLTLIFKRIVYCAISEMFPVYANKNDKFNKKITFKEMYPSLQKVELGKLIYILEKFYGEVRAAIINQ